MSILGNRVLRREDPKFLTVGGTYVDDLRDERLAGAAYVTFVRSTMAHARITSVDTEEAAQAPGVVGVFTAADVGLAATPGLMLLNPAVLRAPLATDVVRFVGEPIVAIVTEQRYQGEDAAELVFVDYDPLPVVVDMEDAAKDEVILHEAAGTNITMKLGEELDPTLFDGCEVVVTEKINNQRVAIAPLEVRSCAAAWDGERLTVWLSTQGPQGARDGFQGILGLEPGQVHLISPDVGGGFGAKTGVAPEEILTGWLARHTGRAMRWTETRTENMLAMGHGRGQVQTVTIGGTRDGTVEAYRLEIVADNGAYTSMGGMLPFLTRMMAAGVYTIPKIESTSVTVVTNTTPTVAYRGAGRPEASAAIERAMDLFAAEIGMDPAELRRKNLIPKDAFPHQTAAGATYDSGDYERALDLALESSGYAELRKDQQARRASGDAVQLGIGVAVYVEVTGGPYAGNEVAKVEITPDGGAKVYTGTSPHGQGHVTSWSMLASEQLGIPMDQIEVIHGDTDLVPVGQGTMGSRSLQLGGSAVHQASVELVELAKQKAADLLEANPDDIVLDKIDGRFHVAGTPSAGRSWAEIVDQTEAPLVVDTVFQAASSTFPFGAHVAVVEVDTETGHVTVKRVITVDDAGVLLNPMIVEGQRHGGIAQGVGQALCEEMVYDADGNPVTSNFADYTFISATELPSFELVPMETPTTANPLGAKGIGESGTIGATPAVQSAVIDALSHLGIRHIDMPATPQRVWSAIQEARG
ncbi:MAG: Carbon-monoxide dehydrogenase (acceptor) [Actinomycetia bacterium]|nr:Carbon-monoxide dehydrogenase (acceptor) [Actinomycetes bacterium]